VVYRGPVSVEVAKAISFADDRHEFYVKFVEQRV
jgi:hypothetical protein